MGIYCMLTKDNEVPVDLPIPLHVMSSEVCASYDHTTNRWTELPAQAAEINVTYNYTKYYWSETYPRGIREIHAKTPQESLVILRYMKDNILQIYCKNGIWQSGEAPCRDYWASTAGNALRSLMSLIEMAEQCINMDCVWWTE